MHCGTVWQPSTRESAVVELEAALLLLALRQPFSERALEQYAVHQVNPEAYKWGV
ncbi:MAG TPA: hypothetical protein VN872_01505 [Candidatus Acidoferrum sp.]|nr:hypothetical protein [Candidatus Acidoferrum sp.]